MKLVTEEAIADLLRRAEATPRRRLNLNLHATPDDPINRFLNAGLPGSYVRPHRHRAGKWELTTVLRGALSVAFFDPEGTVTDRWTLTDRGASLIEIPGGVWHSIVFHPPYAVILEVKPGPHEPQLDKDFTAWAPEEGNPAASHFVAWLERAAVGEKWCGGGEGSDQKPTPLA